MAVASSNDRVVERGNLVALIISCVVNGTVALMGIGVIVAMKKLEDQVKTVFSSGDGGIISDLPIDTIGYAVGLIIMFFALLGVVCCILLWRNPSSCCAKFFLIFHCIFMWALLVTSLVIGALIIGLVSNSKIIGNWVDDAHNKCCTNSQPNDKCDFLPEEEHQKFCQDKDKYYDEMKDYVTGHIRTAGGVLIAIFVFALLGQIADYILCCKCCTKTSMKPGKDKSEAPAGASTAPMGSNPVYSNDVQLLQTPGHDEVLLKHRMAAAFSTSFMKAMQQAQQTLRNTGSHVRSRTTTPKSLPSSRQKELNTLN